MEKKIASYRHRCGKVPKESTDHEIASFKSNSVEKNEKLFSGPEWLSAAVGFLSIGQKNSGFDRF